VKHSAVLLCFEGCKTSCSCHFNVRWLLLMSVSAPAWSIFTRLVVSILVHSQTAIQRNHNPCYELYLWFGTCCGKGLVNAVFCCSVFRHSETQTEDKACGRADMLKKYMRGHSCDPRLAPDPQIENHRVKLNSTRLYPSLPGSLPGGGASPAASGRR